MIPKSSLYIDTPADAMKTMMSINKLLAQFGITEKRLTQQGAQNSSFEFIIRKENDVAILIRIKIPYIETRRRTGAEYDEARSYRYFYHYLKALLSAKEAEIYSIEEIFMAHIVMALPNGGSITLGEQLVQNIESGSAPMLEGFNVMPTPLNRQLPSPRMELKKNE